MKNYKNNINMKIILLICLTNSTDKMSKIFSQDYVNRYLKLKF